MSLPWRGVYQPLSREHGWEPLRVEGRLPDDLRGTLVRNGPGLLSSPDGAPYVHWFDGDGALAAARFGGGGVDGAVRVTDTPWLRAERAAGRQLYRSYAQLGRSWRRWFALPKNQANVGLMPWRGRLFALWEAGMPVEVDPAELRTVGLSDLGGVVGPTLSAHPHALGDTVYNFGVAYGPRFSLHTYAFGDRARRTGTVPLRFPTLVHDFAPTPRYDVFLCPPRRLHLDRLLSGRGSFIENLRWEPDLGTEVLVVPRGDAARAVRFEVPAFFLWHIVGAWEDGGDLVLDAIVYDDDATDGWFGRAPWVVEPPPPARYERARVDLAARTFTREVLLDRACEFAGVHPAEAGGACDRAWMLAWTGPSGEVAPPALCRFVPSKGELTPTPLPEGSFPGEPIIVGRPDGGAWVLAVVYDGASGLSWVGVWDGDRWPEPPVARAWFDHHVPFGLHGAWVEG